MDLKQQIQEQEEKLAALKKLATHSEQVEAFVKKLGYESHADYCTHIQFPSPAVDTPVVAKEKKATVKLTESDKAEIIATFKDPNNKKTAGEIAKEYGVALGTINIIKSENGLTKPRTKKEKAPATAATQ